MQVLTGSAYYSQSQKINNVRKACTWDIPARTQVLGAFRLACLQSILQTVPQRTPIGLAWMTQVFSLIANDHEDEATRLFRHGWVLYQQVQQAPRGCPAWPCKQGQLLSAVCHFHSEGCPHCSQVLNNDYLEHKRLYAAVQSVLAAEARRGPLDVLVKNTLAEQPGTNAAISFPSAAWQQSRSSSIHWGFQ